MNRDVFNANYPAPLIAQFNWYAQTLVIDNHSATAYLYVPAAKRYIAPLQMGAIVNIPSAQSIEVDWQNPPNINSVGTDGDLATVTAYSDILHPANGNTSQVAQGDVTSVFGRTGAVVAEAGDYTAAMVGALADDATVGGDLSGTVPDPKVSGLQGVPISATAPTSGEALVYNGTEWAPGSTSAPVTSVFGRTGAVVAETGDYTAAEVGALADNATVGGDLSGTVPDPKVSGLQGVPISATAPATGQFLEYNGTEWIPTTPAATTNAGELQGVPISTTAPTSGQGLIYNGTDWAPATPSANATELQGVAVSATAPTTDQVLQYNGTDWAPATPSSNATELQGVAVSATAPTTDQVLQYNGTDWVPATLPAASPYLATPTYYAPADTTIAIPTALQAIDSTNLITGSFTVPASGSVVVKVGGLLQAAAGAAVQFGWLNNGTQVGDLATVTNSSSGSVATYIYMTSLITGLTAGASVSLDLAGITSSAGSQFMVGTGSAYAPIIITIEAA